MYIDIIGLRLVCWCARSRFVPSALLLRSCRLALLSVAVAIWCNRAVMRCNRFYVLGGVVLSCVLSCDSGAFYKRLLCVWLVCACLLFRWFVWDGGTACVLSSCSCCRLLLFWCEDGAYWLYVCRYIFIYCCCWRGLWRVLALVWWCCALVAGGLCDCMVCSVWCGVTISMYI